ncbi:Hypothetical protein NCS54_00972400 [Fusarium falciforme]|uniref:Hypothetical protein n=1 Tax=Fusarium falciforme TaxID=195108 RepID=UPI0022FFE1CA|nr:Hypothetical protein NCS54_00972400 [Fusarium falciforme]WAO92227.1 Hypothetical protein NCS54_00972400 [Fusarium falciforme]
MFLSKTSLAFLAMTHGLVAGTPMPQSDGEFDGTRPKPGIECDGLIQPSYKDCRSIIDGNVYFGNGDERDVCVNQRACRIFREGNCRISFCNNEDKEVCDSSKEWGRRTKAIISYCEPDDGGGYESPAEPKPWTEVAIRANTDWKAAMKAAASEPAGVAEEVMTLEENEAEVKQIEEEQKAKHALHARDDDSFEITNRRKSVERPGAQIEMTDRLPNGGKWVASKSKTETVGITASVSLGGSLFDVMTAEIGLEVSSSYSVTSGTSIEIPIECEGNQSGVVIWFPLFDYYAGKFQPSGDSGSIWVPLDSETSTGNFRVRCLGDA